MQNRALSALTWCIKGSSSGFELDHHNVFFEADYPSEFNTIFEERNVPTKPTVYLCAQDRGPNGSLNGSERMLMLVNAPADGDRQVWAEDDVARTRDNALAVLAIVAGSQAQLPRERLREHHTHRLARTFPGQRGLALWRRLARYLVELYPAGRSQSIKGFVSLGRQRPSQDPACPWRRCQADSRRAAVLRDIA